MLYKISVTIFTVAISIYASIIDANNKSAMKIGTCLIDSENDYNNQKKNRENQRCQETIEKSASLNLIIKISKYIRSGYFQLLCFITFIFIFARTISNSIFIIHISINIFTIFLSKKLAYVFFSFKNNIFQHLNYFNYQQ